MAPRKNNKNDTSADSVIAAKLDLIKEHLDKHLLSIDDKIEKLDSRLDNVDVTLIKQQTILEKQSESLQEHIRRTNLLEEKMDNDFVKLDTKLDDEIKSVAKSITPLKMQSVRLKLIAKIAGIVIASGGGVAALVKILSAALK